MRMRAAAAMTMPVSHDMDFLAARLHGRRSRLAEGVRLDELCRVRTVAELARSLYPEERLRSAAELQRHMVLELALELTGLAEELTGPAAAFLAWQRTRLQLENLKVMARGFANGTPPDRLRPHLAALPADLDLDLPALAGAGSFDAFTAAVPSEPLRAGLEAWRGAWNAQPRPFVLETALDYAYLRELLRRAGRMTGAERDDARLLAGHEAGAFQLMLVVRGVFHYAIPRESLVGVILDGSALPAERYAAMLAANDAAGAAALAVGRVVEAVSGDAPELEVQTWNRYLRLANAAFRHGQMGAGAAIGFAAIRRVELANLITLSEGLRIGMDARLLRARLIPRSGEEVPVV
ncbi:MAG: V-type ATPase subunit [Kiritimatiellae bacterium]|nr:V-type ATPase subunit [Kiritimatiellia bacterium]